MAVTISYWGPNSFAISRKILLVRSMFVCFNCQPGRDILCPELSKLYLHDEVGISLLALFYTFGRNTKSPVPILAARYAVQVDDQFEIVLSGPRYSLAEVRKLSLDIRFAWADFPGPIPDWQPHVV